MIDQATNIRSLHVKRCLSSLRDFVPCVKGSKDFIPDGWHQDIFKRRYIHKDGFDMVQSFRGYAKAFHLFQEDWLLQLVQRPL